jgi:hypothetical protein
MERVGEELLARTSFAEQQDGRIGLCNHVQSRKDVSQTRTLTHDRVVPCIVGTLEARASGGDWAESILRVGLNGGSCSQHGLPFSTDPRIEVVCSR